MADELKPTLEQDTNTGLVVRMDNEGPQTKEYFEAELTVVANCETEAQAQAIQFELSARDSAHHIVMSIREFREAGYEIN